MTSVMEAVRLGFNQAGLQLLPVREDGSKAPDVSSWSQFETTRASVAQMRAWNFSTRAGFGVIGGAVSGHVDPWDFDCPLIFDAFVQAADACGLGDVVRQIRAGYEVETPSGGRRWLVRYPSDLPFQDVAFARRPGREGEPKIKTLIEITLFSILAPSNGNTHPSGKPYVQVSGGFGTIARYTADERAALFALARSFDQMPRRDAEPARTKRRSEGNRPGDDFNARMTWPQILEPAGWTRVYDRGEVTAWRRPGKTHGVSATTNLGGLDLFYPFTSSTAFDPDTSYSKFAASAVLHHAGDFRKAALALSRQGYGQQDDPPAVTWTRPAVMAGLGHCVLAPLLLRPYSGWFARGATHLVAGSSGAGKTTLILDLLQQQARGGPFLGHVGARLDFLVLFADRGRVSNQETLARMRLDPATFPLDHLPPTTDSAKAVAHIQAAIERCTELPPAAVFVEGADLLVEDPCKPQIVMPFVAGLRHLAEHYSLAMILSVGAPKSRPQEQYALKRDQVFGSQAWARTCDTVLVLTIVGDGTDAMRDLVVLHRNAAAEKFHLAFVDGRLVETEAKDVTASEMTTWFKDVEVFTKQRFRDAFNVSGARAAQLLEGYVAIGSLREKVKGDRTCYVYRRPKPSPETDGQPRPAPDTSSEPKRTVENVPDNARTDTENEGVSLDFPKDSAHQGVDPLIPLKVCPFVRDGHSLKEDSDKRTRFLGYTRAREDREDLPAFVTDEAGPAEGEPDLLWRDPEEQEAGDGDTF